MNSETLISIKMKAFYPHVTAPYFSGVKKHIIRNPSIKKGRYPVIGSVSELLSSFEVNHLCR
ncbi:MAG TPA: hypothetical protein VFC65_11590 [Prolixibacteraceae bacterium]|nr:hypothetical protein [Prolixibacteraceae bacterium]